MKFPSPTAIRVGVKTILLATDFTQASQAAMNYALGIARYYGSKLVTAHVVWPLQLFSAEASVPFSEQMDAIEEEQMREWIDRVQGTGISHAEVVPDGDVSDCLAWLLSSGEKIDLLVMGTHRRSGLDKLVNGSVSEEMIRQANCPVLVVGPQVLTGNWGRGNEHMDLEMELTWKRILVATDLSSGSLATAYNAVALAEDHDAELTLLHVLEPLADSALLADTIPAESYRLLKLKNLIPDRHDLRSEPKAIVEKGETAETIVRVANKKSIDLIVLGAHKTERHLFLATHLPTSVAHKVIINASCPVLLMPRQQTALGKSAEKN